MVAQCILRGPRNPLPAVGFSCRCTSGPKCKLLRSSFGTLFEPLLWQKKWQMFFGRVEDVFWTFCGHLHGRVPSQNSVRKCQDAVKKSGHRQWGFPSEVGEIFARPFSRGRFLAHKNMQNGAGPGLSRRNRRSRSASYTSAEKLRTPPPPRGDIIIKGGHF